MSGSPARAPPWRVSGGGGPSAQGGGRDEFEGWQAALGGGWAGQAPGLPSCSVPSRVLEEGGSWVSTTQMGEGSQDHAQNKWRDGWTDAAFPDSIRLLVRREGTAPKATWERMRGNRVCPTTGSGDRYHAGNPKVGGRRSRASKRVTGVASPPSLTPPAPTSPGRQHQCPPPNIRFHMVSLHTRNSPLTK